MIRLSLIALLLVAENPVVACSPRAATFSPPVIACDGMTLRGTVEASFLAVWSAATLTLIAFGAPSRDEKILVLLFLTAGWIIYFCYKTREYRRPGRMSALVVLALSVIVGAVSGAIGLRLFPAEAPAALPKSDANAADATAAQGEQAESAAAEPDRPRLEATCREPILIDGIDAPEAQLDGGLLQIYMTIKNSGASTIVEKWDAIATIPAAPGQTGPRKVKGYPINNTSDYTMKDPITDAKRVIKTTDYILNNAAKAIDPAHPAHGYFWAIFPGTTSKDLLAQGTEIEIGFTDTFGNRTKHTLLAVGRREQTKSPAAPAEVKSRANLSPGQGYGYLVPVQDGQGGTMLFSRLEIQNAGQDTILRNWRVVFIRENGQHSRGQVINIPGLSIDIPEPDGSVLKRPIPVAELWPEKGLNVGVPAGKMTQGWLVAVFRDVSLEDFRNPQNRCRVTCRDIDGVDWGFDAEVRAYMQPAHVYQPGELQQSADLQIVPSKDDARAASAPKSELPLAMKIDGGEFGQEHVRLSVSTLANRGERNMSLSFLLHVFYELPNGRPNVLVFEGEWNGDGKNQFSGSKRINLKKETDVQGILDFFIDNRLFNMPQLRSESCYLEIYDSISDITVHFSASGEPKRIPNLFHLIDEWEANQKQQESNPEPSAPNSANPEKAESNDTK